MSQFPPPPPGGHYPPQDDADQSTPGVAIAALICGISGIVIFFIPLIAIAAFVLGIIGLNKISNGQPGRGMALTGVILGAIGSSIGVIAMLIAILLPALGAARRTAERMEGTAQLRDIHQGMVVYSNTNKTRFPGLNSKGQVLADGPMTGNSGDGDAPQARYWILLDGGFILPEQLTSPSETQAIYDYPGTGPVQADHYSYAVLSFKNGGPVPGSQAYRVDFASAPRAAEWRVSLNSQAVVVSDRNTGANTSTTIQSIHTDPGEWRGSMVWGDGHAGFEQSPIVQTKYGSGAMNTQDHLFEDEPPAGSNALMRHK